MPVVTTQSSAAVDSVIAIAGIEEPVISQYFNALNAGDFQTVSQLFAIDGVLEPPFEEKIVGQEAIVAYLEREAKGLLLQPQSGTSHTLDYGCTEFEILGKVQTPWFLVNVSWRMILNSPKAICLVKVKLLASLKELLPLRDASNPSASEV